MKSRGYAVRFVKVAQDDCGEIKREEFLELWEECPESLLIITGDTPVDKFEELQRIVSGKASAEFRRLR